MLKLLVIITRCWNLLAEKTSEKAKLYLALPTRLESECSMAIDGAAKTTLSGAEQDVGTPVATVNGVTGEGVDEIELDGTTGEGTKEGGGGVSTSGGGGDQVSTTEGLATKT